MIWFVYPIVCSIAWGTASVLLYPTTTRIQPFTIGFIDGIIITFANLIAMSVTHQLGDILHLRDVKTLAFLLSYSVLTAGAGILYLVGFAASDVNVSVYSIIASTYPLIAFIGSYLVLKQRENINPYYAISGIVLTLAGVSLVSMYKKK
jgi:drug/metabolite transporter (DMT)-like permease